MRRSPRLALVAPASVAVVALASVACKGSAPSASAPDAGPARPLGSVVAPVEGAGTLGGAVVDGGEAPPRCRVASAHGVGKDGGVDDGVDVRAWIALPAGGLVTVRHPTTTRETTFAGPGIVAPCVSARDEVAFVRSGIFRSEPGSGETPANEQWVVTPSFVVRYGAARVVVDVGVRGGKTRVYQGHAAVWLPRDVPAGFAQKIDDGVVEDAGATVGKAGGGTGGPAPWVPLSDGEVLLLELPPSPPTKPLLAAPAAELAVDTCEELRKAVGAPGVPRAVDAGADAAAGEIGARDVEARREARAACLVADLRVSSLPPAEAAPLAARLEALTPRTPPH